MTFFPERLITIAEFGSPELAHPEKTKLDAAGITAYLGGGFYRLRGRVLLQVPEAQVERALAILGRGAALGGAAEPWQRNSTWRCIHCGSSDVVPNRPYGLIVLVVAGAVALVLFDLRFQLGAFGVVVLGSMAAAQVARMAGKNRCSRCGRSW